MVKRLTERFRDGKAYTEEIINDRGINNSFFTGPPVDRLADYEDTGLNPEEMYKARLLAEWGEDYGDCLWWSFPIEEPPYCGTPLDCDFPNHVTHFTRFVIPQN